MTGVPDSICVVETGSIAADVACRRLLDLNIERVEHFRRRALERGMAPSDTLILVIDGDDRLGALIAEPIMPTDWQAPYRAVGATPVARGLASRSPVNDMLDVHLPVVGAWMRQCHTAVVLVVAAMHVATYAVLPPDAEASS